MNPGKPHQNLALIGVTGGVGAGKSTVAKILAETLDCPIIAADELVSELLKTTQVLDLIELMFGSEIRLGPQQLCREALAKRVFEDAEARRQLESLLHPRVRQKIWQTILACQNQGNAAWVVLDIPLLCEGGLDRICDFVVHVRVPAPIRQSRACARHGWTAEEWQGRENAQIAETEKAKRADAILDNQAGLETLTPQVLALVPQLHRLAPRPFLERWPSWDQDPLS